MKFLAFDIPEAQADASRWLEGHLVSLHLPDLVTELAAIHGTNKPTGSVATVLGENLGRVLEVGLQRVELPAPVFRQLLREPLLLLELQELVLTHGGAYWRALESHSDVLAKVEDNWRRLKSRSPARGEKPVLTPRPQSWFVRPWPWALAVAALVIGFAACFVWLRGWERFAQTPPQPTTEPTPPALWGWNKPDAVSPAASPQEYRNRLAKLIEEWREVAPPADAPDAEVRLAMRLLELRSGATRLQFAAHPLPEDDRKRLQAKAQDWGKKIDILLQNLSDITPKNLLPSAQQLVQSIADDLRAGRLDP